MPASSEINFIPNAPKTNPSVKDQIFQWVIKNGKRIVIITQAIVLLVFLSRFKFDSDIRNITTEIEKNEAIVESLSATEKRYIENQEKLGLIKPIIEKQVDWETRLNDFNKKIPSELVLENVKFIDNTIELSANTKSSQSFQAFIGVLLADSNIQSIVLQASQFDSATGEYSISLHLELKR